MYRLILAIATLVFVGVNYAAGEDDLYCLAQNIYFEAGNQPLAGKIAVANDSGMARLAGQRRPTRNTATVIIGSSESAERVTTLMKYRPTVFNSGPRTRLSGPRVAG